MRILWSKRANTWEFSSGFTWDEQIHNPWPNKLDTLFELLIHFLKREREKKKGKEETWKWINIKLLLLRKHIFFTRTCILVAYSKWCWVHYCLRSFCSLSFFITFNWGTSIHFKFISATILQNRKELIQGEGECVQGFFFPSLFYFLWPTSCFSCFLIIQFGVHFFRAHTHTFPLRTLTYSCNYTLTKLHLAFPTEQKTYRIFLCLLSASAFILFLYFCCPPNALHGSENLSFFHHTFLIIVLWRCILPRVPIYISERVLKLGKNFLWNRVFYIYIYVYCIYEGNWSEGRRIIFTIKSK